MSDLIEETIKPRIDAMDIATTPCRSCGEEILFLKTNADKWMPVNLDLTPHWSSCPEAKQWRKKR